MSIINDAIKKARKEFELKNRPVLKAVPEKEAPPPPEGNTKSSDVKWTAVVVISLVVTATLLGSLILYKDLYKIDRPYKQSTASIKTTRISGPFRDTRKNKPSEGIELNGIVCGPKDRWAIINNKIVREGDRLSAGTLTLIKKDFVEIVEDNGGELILKLR